MKTAIVLLIFVWALVNTFDLSQHRAVSESQALSFNWFKQWRKKPAIPTPIPITIPEYKSILTPEHRPIFTPERKTITIPKSRPIMTPEHKSVITTNLGQQFKLLEGEVIGARQSKSLFGPEHANRILRDLVNLENKGYSKTETDKLRQVVYQLTPDFNKTSNNQPSSENCAKANPTLVADITDFSKIQKITAPGTDSSEGPKGHSFVWTNGLKVPIYAPIDMILDSGSYGRDNADAPAQYILWFLVKGYCDFQVKFDHIDEPIDSIRQNFPSTPKIADSRGSQVANKVEFKAGDLVGYTKGNTTSGNWDFGLYDMSREGILAKYGSQGSHRNAVCWVDFYSSAKKELYRRLLEGPRLLCSFSSSSTSTSTPQPTSAASSVPVIKNLGINFDTAFVFLQSENKLFLEYGAQVQGPNGTKILPTFEYRTALGVDVFAAMDGIITNVGYQSANQDYYVHIQSAGNSRWVLEHDHVRDLKVSKGDSVKAGDVLGKVGSAGSLGRTEIMFWDASGSSPMTYCPLKYFDSQLLEQYKQKITKHMKDWEEFKSDASLYDESKHILPGCVYEKLAD